VIELKEKQLMCLQTSVYLSIFIMWIKRQLDD